VIVNRLTWLEIDALRSRLKVFGVISNKYLNEVHVFDLLISPMEVKGIKLFEHTLRIRSSDLNEDGSADSILAFKVLTDLRMCLDARDEQRLFDLVLVIIR
jgi:hypothetical protein